MPLLKRELGLLDIFCIASGAMISSGLFILPALAYRQTGPAVILSYILAGIMLVPTMLAQAELSTAMPKTGGSYFFIERSLGAAPGTFGGLATWFSLSLKSAFALLGIGIFALLLSPNINQLQVKLIAICFSILFISVNLIGVKHTGRLQVFLVLGLIGILVFYIIWGLLSIQPQRYFPFAPYGWGSVFSTAGLVFISYAGLTKIAAVAEEVRNPGRNIPLGMFLSFCIITLLYVLVVFTTVGLLDPILLRNSLTPIALGARVFAGRGGEAILAVAALLAFVSTANAGLLSASRNPMAMSRDQLLPNFLAKVSSKFQTPHYAVIFTGAFMILAILLLDLKGLVEVASTLMILLFLLVNISLIIMRESRIRNYQPKFKSPLYPWIQILGIIGYGFLLLEMGRTPLLITAGFVGCGLGWWGLWVRPRTNRRSALIHIVERITARELAGHTLEDELKEILMERDNIIEDRFDKLIKECEILDVQGSPQVEEFFKLVAQALSPRLQIEEEELCKMLIRREAESTTAIHPGLAIPHIIVEGTKKFAILLARCKEGISFSPTLPPVRIGFVLVGSPDERNSHLRALMAIAQIAQEVDFERNFLEAKDVEEMRHIILLSNRKREPK